MLIKFHEPASGYNSKNTHTVLIPVEAADQEGVSSGPVCRAVGLVSFGTWDINAEKENRRVGSGLMVLARVMGHKTWNDRGFGKKVIKILGGGI